MGLLITVQQVDNGVLNPASLRDRDVSNDLPCSVVLQGSDGTGSTASHLKKLLMCLRKGEGDTVIPDIIGGESLFQVIDYLYDQTFP
ncbi:hypothetical protein [Caudoviricetes sp.]|nr:hypothetical protein [Caudoviricetes sp.]